MRHLALQSRGGASVDLGRCVFYTPAQGGRRRGFFSDPPPPPPNHSHFPTSVLREFGEVSWTIWSSCGLYPPPSPPSASRKVTARLLGPILQPRGVEATAAVDQSARTEGGLAEDLLPAGQTQPDTSGFPGPQKCP